MQCSATSGLVSLVGAGPGDAELLTIKAYKRIRQADVVLYDRLVSEEVLALLSDHAQRFYVGKARSMHSVPQSEINQSLVQWAKQGKRVVRLKGGDPFLFGRGGEELEELITNGVAVEVIPGITAASGCSAYAGIPLTHRDYAQTVVFTTGHSADGEYSLDWEALARPGQTLVFYMGLGSVDVISRKLMAAGLAADTPLAVVEQGTTCSQQTHVGTLSLLPEALTTGRVRSPALLLIGSVVSLHSRLAWFEGARWSASNLQNDLPY